MRTFIAVDFPTELLTKIEAISAFFKTKTPEKALKWVETDKLHLTLKFIGEINPTQVEQVKTILAKSLTGQRAFDIEVGGLGMYPNRNNPRVIWLGISGADPMIEIHRILEQDLAAIDIMPERREFTPHLTLARVRRSTDKETAKMIGKTLSQFVIEPLGTISINQVRLYQSVLTPSGPIYTPLYSVPLNQV
jgi:2'-5' RNA ligase